MEEFDGAGFTTVIFIVILVVLFFYGSTDIEDYTTGPTPV
ncbi:hypothetical protein GCM10010917_41330 [Paenibacillus physcomitrellae]|uniref:Uncharacterized protein n=1 Tax=Paenibacillus physcomitrellae TaxID=1619311 RepID=A0ABQ1GWM0_9BACL|nr:hypothetical protein GCM10010917_41330 [Paenibacillus physcomitrellae]